MDIKVISKFVKVSPLKVRPVLHGLRGQNAEKALTELHFTNKKGAKLMYDLLKSALAAAKENDLERENIFIKSVFCGDGPRLKRRLIGSRGRSNPILKRMSHLTLVVSDKAEEKTGVKPKEKDIELIKNSKKQETIDQTNFKSE